MKKNWFKIAGLAFLALSVAALGVVAYAEDDTGSTSAGWSQGKKTGWDDGGQPPGRVVKRETRKAKGKMKKAAEEAENLTGETKVKNAQAKAAKETKRAEGKAEKDSGKFQVKVEKESKKAQKKAEQEAKKNRKENEKTRRQAEKQVRKYEKEIQKKAKEVTGKSTKQAKGFAGL